MRAIDRIEAERLALQAALDGEKTPEDRNKMGQFATPTVLARDILRHGVGLLDDGSPIRFFDPAIGTGSFYSALRAIAPETRIQSAGGCEIDPHYGLPARKLWEGEPLDLRMADFTKERPKGHELANLLICNPPYVRHHHIDAETKAGIQLLTEQACGVKINGLSGLYCYFMGLAHQWMADDAIAGWLIPSEFMGVNYGRMLKSYLLRKVTLLQIHRFDPENVQFSDALVSSAVVWFKKSPPPADHCVLFTYGGTLERPDLERLVPTSELEREPKWTRYPLAQKATKQSQVTLGHLLDIKRGLATGDNDFFIMSRAQIDERGLPIECFTPVLPSSRYIEGDEIDADEHGFPTLKKQLFLLDTRLPEDEIAQKYPALKTYLDAGRRGDQPVSERYLCKARRPWYSQENRPAAPIICTYMGRSKGESKPFRFILNRSNATACNVFLMLYPKPLLAKAMAKDPTVIRIVWEFLNDIDSDELLGHGRVYGGGLHKLEPKELRGFPADRLAALIPALQPLDQQSDLLERMVA
jgi:hypothetical protein